MTIQLNLPYWVLHELRCGAEKWAARELVDPAELSEFVETVAEMILSRWAFDNANL